MGKNSNDSRQLGKQKKEQSTQGHKQPWLSG